VTRSESFDTRTGHFRGTAGRRVDVKVSKKPQY